ncbi:MAG: hypothetical protein Q9195_006763 [Heterodermia aff. obscurata]
MQQASLIMRLLVITDGIIKQRVWLFVKQMRGIGLRQRKPMTEMEQFGVEGVEDAFFEAHVVFEPPALCRLMYKSVDIEIFLSNRPNFGIFATDITKVEIVQEMALVFDKPGSIQDCGIPALRGPIRLLLEQYDSCKEQLPQPPGRGSLYQVLSQEQLREIWIRNGTELLFEDTLKSLLPVPTIKALKHVMFEKLYRLEFGGRLRKCRDADEYSSDSILD